MSINWAETAQLTRKGNADFLPTSKGLRRVRTWQPSSGQWRLTALGIRYFTEAASEYVISLPVRWNVERKDRTQMLSYPGWFPVSPPQLPAKSWKKPWGDTLRNLATATR